MKYIVCILAMAMSLHAYSQPTLNLTRTSAGEPSHNVIQLALLLDVSGSMTGLINQAKSELWTIVNEVAKASKNDYHARLEIALYEYGRGGGDASQGYVMKRLDYTNDLDTISEVLFSLSITGSEEYCGLAIQDALDELKWRSGDSVYRVIFIAGNEPFTQGPVAYTSSCQKAREKGIIVNTIHCGDSMEGIRSNWEAGAKLAAGSYFFINQNSKAYDIPTPFDSMMGVYNDSLNGTYWAYGANAWYYSSNQSTQDANASKMGGAVKAKRALSKTKSVYSNGKWDAVDRAKSDTAWVKTAKDEELPDNLKGKTPEQRQQALDSATNKRAYFSKQIGSLNTQREKFIQDNKPVTTERTLGTALIEAIHKQGNANGFVFE